MSLKYSYIGFGANLGEPKQTLSQVVQEMNSGASKVRRISRLFLTTPWGDASGPDYTNAVIELETSLPAHDLLQSLQKIERFFGRERLHPNAPRVCDLDILLHKGEVISENNLVIPHPRLHLRRFILMPLCDLIPNEKHPTLGRTFRKLLENLQDEGTAVPIGSVKSSVRSRLYE